MPSSKDRKTQQIFFLYLDEGVLIEGSMICGNVPIAIIFLGKGANCPLGTVNMLLRGGPSVCDGLGVCHGRQNVGRTLFEKVMYPCDVGRTCLSPT